MAIRGHQGVKPHDHEECLRKIEELEKRCLATQGLYRAVLEAVPAGVVICNPTDDGRDFTVTEINEAAEKMEQLAREDVVGEYVSEAFFPSSEGLVALMNRVSRSGRPEKFSAYRDNDCVSLRECCVRRLPGGQIVIVFTDATGRLELESKILQAQKLESLEVLAGGIAHDFNNLLVGILGNSELALMDMQPEAPAREHIKRVEKTAKKATDLVKQMLAYSGKGRFVLEPLEPKAIVQEMTHLLELSISRKAFLKYDFADSVPLIEADATQVRQIIINLVTNASDAIGDRSGVICIATGAMECDRSYLSETYLDDDLPEGLYSYVEVSDTGIGIPLKVRERIFDPFFTTKFTGRGLGLAAVLGIVRGHRGAVKVYSELGRGTTVKVLFPSLDQCEFEPQAVNLAKQVWAEDGKVLLVDDEETVRAVGRSMLERLGLEVITACDGQEALDLFTDHADGISCVILDLTMPVLDGEQCFRELRRLKRDIPVILTSGYNEQDLISRFAGKGLAGFMQKPYRLAVLEQKIQEAMGAGNCGSSEPEPTS